MKKFKQYIKENNQLSNIEIELLKSLDTIQNREGGILRKHMDKAEIKAGNKLSKLNYISKGTSDDKQKSVTFFITRKGQIFLNNI